MKAFGFRLQAALILSIIIHFSFAALFFNFSNIERREDKVNPNKKIYVELVPFASSKDAASNDLDASLISSASEVLPQASHSDDHYYSRIKSLLVRRLSDTPSFKADLVSVLFTVLRSGQLESYQIVYPTEPDESLRSAVREVFRRSFPFDAFPREIKEDKVMFSANLRSSG